MHNHKQPHSYRFSITKNKAVETYIKKLSKAVQEFERWSISDQSTTFITSRYTFPKKEDYVAEARKVSIPKNTLQDT